MHCDKEMELTILTDPVGVLSNIKIVLKKLLGRQKKYGGHSAVTRSLVEGLEKIGYDRVNYQPRKERDIAENVHVLANVSTLKYAIKLKKKGIIKQLTAGPNIVVFSDEYDGIIADSCVDKFLQPSEWAAKAHEKYNEKLVGRCVAWPAGVDLQKIQLREKKRSKVLIYLKREGIHFCYRVDYLLRSYGYQTTIITYGNYELKDYLNELDETKFMVVLGRQESQGLFLAEAWSKNVPTICFDPHYYKWEDYNREIAGDVSTCPYLSQQTGVRFEELNELKNILANYEEISKSFQPRKWVEENMTDEVCAKKFLELLNIK